MQLKAGLHHQSGSVCGLCVGKLDQAAPELRRWFKEMKAIFPTLHVSCAYRGKEEQNKAFASGKSKLKFPESRHNAVDRDGRPAARALDVFSLTEEGIASFAAPFYEAIWKECKKRQDCVVWGGNWKSLGDANHFELI